MIDYSLFGHDEILKSQFGKKTHRSITFTDELPKTIKVEVPFAHPSPPHISGDCELYTEVYLGTFLVG